MSASRLIFGMVLGGALATGSLYVTQHPEKFPWMAKSMGVDVTDESPQLAKLQAAMIEAKATNEEKVTAAVGETAPLPGADAVTPTEVDREIAKEEPSLAGREIQANARETMAASIALRKRMTGEALTGSGVQDKLLGDLEKQELDDQKQMEDAAKAPNSGTRSPAASTVIVMDGTTGVDPSAEDRINELAVPESVRQEIMNNYRRTGKMPAFVSGK
jgi:hypothetical protein